MPANFATCNQSPHGCTPHTHTLHYTHASCRLFLVCTRLWSLLSHFGGRGWPYWAAEQQPRLVNVDWRRVLRSNVFLSIDSNVAFSVSVLFFFFFIFYFALSSAHFATVCARLGSGNIVHFPPQIEWNRAEKYQVDYCYTTDTLAKQQQRLGVAPNRQSLRRTN